MFIFSCSIQNQSNDLNIKNSQLTHSKLTNFNNDLLYQEYENLVIEYGLNSSYPDINN